MFSRSIGIGLLAAGCLTAAAGGAYVAVRKDAAAAPAPGAEVGPASESVAAPETVGSAPVTETEAVVEPLSNPKEADRVMDRREPRPAPSVARTPVPKGRPARGTERLELPADAVHPPVESGPPPQAQPRLGAPHSDGPEPTPSAQPQVEEVVLPTSSVIGLEVETSVSSERARTEDRVDARVTRDVYVDGRLVIPSRSRMIGAVTLVERGGKMKERARLGVRFHTVVLDGGRQIALRTETIVREGESPSAESSRKIGGAAIGGAVLGAIMGGGKGALLGGATGAAGGTAAVMAGGRSAATFTSGTIVTARLSGPVSIEIEKR